MPKLKLFLSCERAITNSEDNSVSLITVIDGITIPKPSDSNSVVAVRWDTVATWEKDEQDADKAFEQRTCLVLPDGTETNSAIIKFIVKDTIHRNTVHVFGFPVAQAGIYKLKLYLREEGNENWNEISEYQILVTHLEDKGEQRP